MRHSVDQGTSGAQGAALAARKPLRLQGPLPRLHPGALRAGTLPRRIRPGEAGMRSALRRVAFVGDLELSVTEALRALGCRVERIDGTSVVAVARDLMCIRPAVVHARSAHLKVGLVARLLNVPLVVQAGRGDVNAITARAARVAERTLCATVSLRGALVEQGAPPSTTSVMRGLLDEKTELRGGG